MQARESEQVTRLMHDPIRVQGLGLGYTCLQVLREYWSKSVCAYVQTLFTSNYGKYYSAKKTMVNIKANKIIYKVYVNTKKSEDPGC